MDLSDIRVELSDIKNSEAENDRKRDKEMILDWVLNVNYGSNYNAVLHLIGENDVLGAWFLKG
jgi:hypothetical protein